MNQRNLTAYRVLADVKRARRDHADKGWLACESNQSDTESRARMECLTFVAILIGGSALGVALYDWTQGMAWAHALVALVYQVGPL